MHLILLPFVAAIGQAIGLLIDRFAIKKLRLHFLTFCFWLFTCLGVFTALLQPVMGGFRSDLLIGVELKWFIAVLFLAPSWNYLYFKAVKFEKAMYIESVANLSPLLSIMGAWLLAPTDFKYSTFAAIAAACLLLLWGYRKKHHFVADKYILLIVGAMVLSAAENILVSKLLKTGAIQPATLFLSRVVVMIVFFGLLAKRAGKLKISSRGLRWCLLTGVIGTVMMISRFYGLRDSGIVTTSAVLLLSPAFVYKGSAIFLHEKITSRQVSAFFGMIVAVIVAVYFHSH